MTAARCRPTSEHELTAAKFKLAGSLALLVVLCTLSLLTGCAKREVQAQERNAEAEQTRYTPILYVDEKTGCEYLSADGGGITPRIAADGKSHMGCKGVQP
jgi:hypothetical protein